MYPDTIYIPQGSQLLINDSHGQYIPQLFAEQFRDRVTPASSKEITDEDWDILLAGPEHEFYWDTWTAVLDNCILVDENGREFSLMQEQDVWAIPVPHEPDDSIIFNRTAHQELWNWLAENPDCYKSEWPGWHHYAAKKDDCFACETANAIRPRYARLCVYCPLQWPKGKPCYNGLYAIWQISEDPRIRRSLARYIANLPVKEEYKYV